MDSVSALVLSGNALRTQAYGYSSESAFGWPE